MREEADIAIVGAGAAGLMAAIQAGRHGPERRIVLLDGARTIGAKILVAGGGRCNVTHHAVDERAFAGSTPAAIRKVLRQFDVPATIGFFAALGVELKREETGKLFPVTDKARTVLDALVRAVAAAGVELVHPYRVDSITVDDGGFLLRGGAEPLRARRVVLATGGKSLPKSGSDGHGYALARALGHSVTPRIEQALVPLLLPEGHLLCSLQGVAAPARLEVRSSAGKRLAVSEGPLLCTHFGISGPAALDISRHWLHAPEQAELVVCWLPAATRKEVDGSLQDLRGSNPAAWARERLPARLADALVRSAGIDPGRRHVDLGRDARRALVTALTELVLPISGPRGWTWAEVTAGGVPLAELRLDTLASRVCPGLHLCGEILDVDGRIGGFNFQWAWASGSVAGRGACA